MHVRLCAISSESHRYPMFHCKCGPENAKPCGTWSSTHAIGPGFWRPPENSNPPSDEVMRCHNTSSELLPAKIWIDAPLCPAGSGLWKETMSSMVSHLLEFTSIVCPRILSL